MIEVKWDTEEKTAVVWVFEPGWTWEEFNAAIQTTWDHVNLVDHPVNVILDISSSVLIPRSTEKLDYIRRGVSDCVSQHGIVVAATPNTLARSLVHIFRYLDRKLGPSFYTAHSIPDARRIIEKHGYRKPDDEISE